MRGEAQEKGMWERYKHRLALPKSGRDRLGHKPGQQERLGSYGIGDNLAHELSHPAAAVTARRIAIRRI